MTEIIAETVQVEYDRTVVCEPFEDAELGARIGGLSVFVRFARRFRAPVDDVAEPAGAAELNRSVRMSYQPESGFSPATAPDGAWEISGYAVSVLVEPGVFAERSITRDEFYTFLRRQGDHFDQDLSLSSSCYRVVPTGSGHEMEVGQAIPGRGRVRR